MNTLKAGVKIGIILAVAKATEGVLTAVILTGTSKGLVKIYKSIQADFNKYEDLKEDLDARKKEESAEEE